MLGWGPQGPRLDSQLGRVFFTSISFQEEMRQEQQQKQQLEKFLGLWPMPQTKIIFNLIRKIEFRQSRWHRRWGGRSSCRKWPPARLTSSTETATDLRLSRPRHRVTTTGPTRARAATTELGLKLASSGFLRS